jgi:hypothetical protein
VFAKIELFAIFAKPTVTAPEDPPPVKPVPALIDVTVPVVGVDQVKFPEPSFVKT